MAKYHKQWTYPLSATTFVQVLENSLYFGHLTNNFNPFLSNGPSNSHINLIRLPNLNHGSELVKASVCRSRISKKAYIFRC